MSKRRRASVAEIREGGRPYRSFDDPKTLALLVEKLPAAVYITNEAGEILDVNRPFLELFGIESKGDLEELTVSDLLVDPDARRRQRALLERTGEARQFEFRILRRDGGVRTVLDTCYRVRDEGDGEILNHGVLIDISERKALEERLRALSVRDPLTGCHNRRQLATMAEELDPSDRSWGAIVVDIDHFKRYNDEHGHAAGDAALVKLARALYRHVRADDAVVRLGGDEFLVLLVGEGEAATRLVADRLRRERRNSGVPSFSLGCAVRERGESVQTTIGRADVALLDSRAER